MQLFCCYFKSSEVYVTGRGSEISMSVQGTCYNSLSDRISQDKI